MVVSPMLFMVDLNCWMVLLSFNVNFSLFSRHTYVDFIVKVSVHRFTSPGVAPYT